MRATRSAQIRTATSLASSGSSATGHRVRGWLVFVSGLAVGVMVSTPLKGPVPADELPEGRELFGALPRILAAVGSGVSALVIFGGALWTTWQFLQTRSAPPGRVAGNLLIAAGTIVLSASGTLAGRLGKDRAFIVTLLVGIVILFAGFLVAGTRPARPVDRPTARPRDAARDANALATRADEQASRVVS